MVLGLVLKKINLDLVEWLVRLTSKAVVAMFGVRSQRPSPQWNLRGGR
jgi:hypothetical protein